MDLAVERVTLQGCIRHGLDPSTGTTYHAIIVLLSYNYAKNNTEERGICINFDHSDKVKDLMAQVDTFC